MEGNGGKGWERSYTGFTWLGEAVELVEQQQRRNLKDLWSSTQLGFSNGPVLLSSTGCFRARRFPDTRERTDPELAFPSPSSK